MAAKKHRLSWRRIAQTFLAAVFIISAAWAAYYLIDAQRSQTSLHKLSEDLSLARSSAVDEAVRADGFFTSDPNSPSGEGTMPIETITNGGSFSNFSQAASFTQSPRDSFLQETPPRESESFTTTAQPIPSPTSDSLPSALHTIKPLYQTSAPDPLSAYYATLQQRNSDFAGWIHIDGTIVDYPVMYSPDNMEKYLHRDFEGNYSFAGLPFLDTSYPPDSSGVNQIIYAHNMKSGQMFAVLNEYLKEDFWQEHTRLSFDTLNTRRDYEALALIPLILGPMDSPRMMIFHPLTTSNEEAVAEINTYLNSYARQLRGEIQVGDDLLTLVTCRRATESDRLILLARRSGNQ